MATIEVWTQPQCQPCKAVKRWLDKHGLPYDELNVQEDANVHLVDTIKQKTAGTEFPASTPVTVYGDTWVHGYNPNGLKALAATWAKDNNRQIDERGNIIEG